MLFTIGNLVNANDATMRDGNILRYMILLHSIAYQIYSMPLVTSALASLMASTRSTFISRSMISRTVF